MSALRWRWLAIAAAALGSCCPSGWIEVTREPGAPPQPIADPVAAAGPILPPLDIPNRFDLLDDSREVCLTPKQSPGCEQRYNRAHFTTITPPGGKPSATNALAWAGVTDIERLVRRRAATTPRSTHVGRFCRDPRSARIYLPGVHLPRPAPSLVRFSIAPDDVLQWAAPLEVNDIEKDEKEEKDERPLGAFGPLAGRPPPTGAAAAPRRCSEVAAPGTGIVLGSAPDLPDGALVEVDFPSTPVSTPFLTFVQLSDVQIRDASIHLTDRDLAERLDRLINSFEYDEDQARYGEQILAAVVGTINAEVEAESLPAMKPSFVIHTGDSIDSGTFGELARFHRVMDRLRIPWFNVLGNHDVLVFGNLIPTALTDPDGDGTCVDASSISRPYGFHKRWVLPHRLCVASRIVDADRRPAAEAFIAQTTPAATRAVFIRQHGHVASDIVNELEPLVGEPEADDNRFVPPDPPATDGAANIECSEAILSSTERTSLYHGFDFYYYDGGTAGAEKFPDRGYYAFSQPLGKVGLVDRRAIHVVLNTEDLEPNEGGNSGRLGSEQYAWLKRVMQCAHRAGPHDLIFMYGHHPLSMIKLPSAAGAPPRWADYLALRDDPIVQTPNIVAYLYGHHHEHGICRDKGACKRFWELETGSLLETPQEGRLVRLYTLGDGVAGVGYIETTTFAERLAGPETDFTRMVALGHLGAQHDRCIDPRFRCSPDGRVYRTDGPHTHGRLFFRLP